MTNIKRKNEFKEEIIDKKQKTTEMLISTELQSFRLHPMDHKPSGHIDMDKFYSIPKLDVVVNNEN